MNVYPFSKYEKVLDASKFHQPNSIAKDAPPDNLFQILFLNHEKTNSYDEPFSTLYSVPRILINLFTNSKNYEDL